MNVHRYGCIDENLETCSGKKKKKVPFRKASGGMCHVYMIYDTCRCYVGVQCNMNVCTCTCTCICYYDYNDCGYFIRLYQ